MRLKRSSIILTFLLTPLFVPGCSSARDASSAQQKSGSAPGSTAASSPGAAATGAAASPGLPALTASTASGVYTDAQANRGKQTWKMVCANCHTAMQHAGPLFAAAWNGRSLFDLYEKVSNTMPQNDPGSLSEDQYIDVITWLLKMNGTRTGAAELPIDTAMLKRTKIEIKVTAGP